MKNSNTFSILFWLRLSNPKNRKAPLYARISVNGKRAELSLKRKIVISDWDTGKSRLKGLSDNSKLINNYIDQIYMQLFDCYQKLSNQNRLITSKMIKAKFLGIDEKHYSLLDIMEYHNQYMKDTLRWGTQKNYFTTNKYIKFFLQKNLNTSNMYLTELGYKFIIDFERFLRHQNDMGNNT
jgi:integrase/recombinase XerD